MLETKVQFFYTIPQDVSTNFQGNSLGHEKVSSTVVFHSAHKTTYSLNYDIC